jgi:hypothetical protein
MAIDTSIPQVAALKLAVEKRFGHPIETRSDFTLLAADIERTTRDHIAENTLRRLWGRISSYDTVFTRTLDILSKYIGHEQWKSYCEYLSKEKNPESEIVVEAVSIRVEDLKPGDKIRIGWLPDRICIVQYMGGRTFKAIDAKNATLQIGDTFECSLMLKNFPLFVENLVHGGEYCNRYTMGMINGITTLEKL